MVQNFREIAGNPININFRDRYIFCECRRRAPLAGRIRFPRPQLHVASSTFRYYNADYCEKNEEERPKKQDDTIRVPVMRRVRGFHEYRSVWTLSCSREMSNLHDPFAEKVLKTDEIVNHLPKKDQFLCARARFLKVSVQIQSHLQ